MPWIRVDGIEIYYEVHGAGPPLLLIAGLGATTGLWFKQIPALSRHFQLIVFDNRGVGQSDKPDEPYAIPMFAADTAGLLKQLGIKRAHVLGASMGGFIAQALALSHPELVRKLILCSTSFGGPNAVLPSPEVLQFMALRSDNAEENFRRGLELAFTSQYWSNNPQEIERMRQRALSNPQPRYAYLRQVMSVAGFNAEPGLQQIKVPVLVMAGEEDRTLPPENSRRLAAALPKATLMLFRNAGHLFFIEQADEFNAALVEFLSSEGKA